jgi:SAM-dependent methyltransferase
MTTRYQILPCPACGADAATTVADGDQIRDEVEQLWAFHTRRLRGDTPPERLQDRVAFSQAPPLRIARCDTCSLLYRSPREHAETLIDTYRDERPDADALRTLFDNQRRSYRAQARRLTRLLGRTGRGLEVGSYVGAFLAAARDEGWTFSGVDVNAAANACARDEGFDVCDGTIEDVNENVNYDVVAFWNCFDQLPDPKQAAEAARQRLTPGGLLAVRVPNGAFYERWRSRLGPGGASAARPLARLLLAHSNLLGFPYRHGFSRESLGRLLTRTGFGSVRWFGDALVPTADRWTRSWAAAEGQLVRTALRAAPSSAAPWLEAYATAV